MAAARARPRRRVGIFVLVFSTDVIVFFDQQDNGYDEVQKNDDDSTVSVAYIIS